MHWLVILIHFIIFGDYGNTNAGANALTTEFVISYAAPNLSINVGGNGYVTMLYGYGTGSDERIKQILKQLKMH